MVNGGFFTVLDLIVNNVGNVKFSSKDIISLSGLSSCAVSRHLSNLVKAGYLTKVSYRKQGFSGLFVDYTINGNVLRDVMNNFLYDDEVGK